MFTKTFTLTGNSSVLYHVIKNGPIVLHEHEDYSLGLKSFSMCNSVPNIDEYNNCIQVGTEKIKIPIGSYEIEDIEKYLQGILGEKEISIKGNNNTLQCELRATKPVDFHVQNSIGPTLGFSPALLSANKTHISDHPVDLVKLNVIMIDCNITTGAYLNGEEGHSIHQFSPIAPPGYQIIETIPQPTYLEVNTKLIDVIALILKDQNGNLLNVRGEKVIATVHLKNGL